MASPGAIIMHGSTPTGFGIRQRSNGMLRATSPCCGRTIGNGVRCKGCSEQYDPMVQAGGALLDGDVSPTSGVVHQWVSNVTGYSEVTVSIL
jgi:hypothetical protein